MIEGLLLTERLLLSQQGHVEIHGVDKGVGDARDIEAEECVPHSPYCRHVDRYPRLFTYTPRPLLLREKEALVDGIRVAEDEPDYGHEVLAVGELRLTCPLNHFHHFCLRRRSCHCTG